MGGKSLKGFVVLVFFFTAIVLGQESQVNEENYEKLKEESISVFKSKGEEGLRNFLKSKEGEISNKFVLKIADSGVKERNEEWLTISTIIAEENGDEKILADILNKLGEYFRLSSNNSKAMNYFDKALLIYIKINDLMGLGNIYYRIGAIYFANGDRAKALEMFEKSLNFHEKAGDIKGQGYVYYGLGDIYYRNGDTANAVEMYDKALSLFSKSEDSSGQGSVYHRKGEIYLNTGDNSKAAEMYDQALALFIKTNDLLGQGNAYMSKGKIFLIKGDYSLAIEMFDKSLFCYEKAGIILGQGAVYFRKGLIHLQCGDNIKAIEMYNKAMFFYEKAGSAIGQGNVYWCKGEIYLRTGDTLRALEMYEKSLPFFEKAGDLSGQGNVYFIKGKIYLGIGDTSRAQKMLEKGLFFFEKSGNSVGIGNIYWSKGDVYFRSGDNLLAQEMYDKALFLFEKAGNVVGEGTIYWSKGDIYFSTGNISKAIEMYDKALPFFEKVRVPIGQGDVYRRKGEIYFSVQNYATAIEMFEKALSLYTKISAIEQEAYALIGKAKVLNKQGKKEEALNLFEKSISNLEKIRTQTPSSEMKRTFMEKLYDQYDEAADFMLENKYYDRAFKYVELMKSRVFLDRLSEGLVSLEKGITPELKQKRDDLVSKLSILSKEMSDAAGKDDEKKSKEIKEQYQKIQNDFEELLVKIRLNNPLYASVQYPEPLSLKDLQENVLRKEDLLLRYFVSSDTVYIFVISKGDFNVIKLELKADQLQKIVQDYLLSIEEKNSREIRRYGIKLYGQLFKPLESNIKDRKEIIVIPDGELAKVPFELLIMDDRVAKKPHYLLEKYRVKYIQSASILAILRKHYRRNSGAGNFIGFGDPVYDSEDLEKEKTATSPSADLQEDVIGDISRSRYRTAGGILTRLKGSGEEVNTISGLFKKQSQKCVIYLRQEANETNAKAREIKEFDYIHFSCHGILGDDFQGLVLSQLPQSAEDGYLTLNEIMNCDYNAKLVVLSACQTGKGKMEKGEGVTGLTQAVMYAGTPSVIASLWNVDDISTKELMVGFYKYMLEEGATKEEALRKAKLDLLKSKKYSSPFFWGAFVMYGE